MAFRDRHKNLTSARGKKKRPCFNSVDAVFYTSGHFFLFPLLHPIPEAVLAIPGTFLFNCNIFRNKSFLCCSNSVDEMHRQRRTQTRNEVTRFYCLNLHKKKGRFHPRLTFSGAPVCSIPSFFVIIFAPILSSRLCLSLRCFFFFVLFDAFNPFRSLANFTVAQVQGRGEKKSLKRGLLHFRKG